MPSWHVDTFTFTCASLPVAFMVDRCVGECKYKMYVCSVLFSRDENLTGMYSVLCMSVFVKH